MTTTEFTLYNQNRLSTLTIMSVIILSLLPLSLVSQNVLTASSDLSFFDLIDPSPPFTASSPPSPSPSFPPPLKEELKTSSSFALPSEVIAAYHLSPSASLQDFVSVLSFIPLVFLVPYDSSTFRTSRSIPPF